jgi:hypothetical protein
MEIRRIANTEVECIQTLLHPFDGAYYEIKTGKLARAR